VAGFDFDVPYQESELALLRALLLKMQRLCKSQELEIHYRRKTAPDHFYVTVDGTLRVMQASVSILARVIPAFAEGAVAPPDRRRRMLLAERLIRSYWQGVLRITEMINDVSSYLSSSGFPAATPNSFFFATVHDDAINERLWSLTTTLIAYENGEVGPSQMLEEVHTALEWVMQAVIGQSAKKLTYAQMAESLRDSGIISPDRIDKIIGMKDLRRDAKHRGQSVDRGEFNTYLSPCLEAIHQILAAFKPEQQ
jgi:hypothetical protein